MGGACPGRKDRRETGEREGMGGELKGIGALGALQPAVAIPKGPCTQIALLYLSS